ncbi:DUF3306 domain-containing protein [Falsiroseomonas sp.]|uniref:DUF3306 domain-containing protein n=1 Tax=Falsiroseomonas sp. TaxID=2870721 RepID=UPI003F6EEA5E
MSGEGEPGFLGRWSRRKRGMEAEAETPPDALAMPEPLSPDPTGDAAADSTGGVPKSGTCPIPGMEPIDLSTLPRIDELSVTSDLAPFLRPGIPAALRSAALRRMWSLDPAIRDYIGPVEYQWDFNTPGGLPNGFASELIGDVQKLLAQAIGAVEEKPASLDDAAPPEEAPLPEPGTLPEPGALPDSGPAVMVEAPAMLPPGATLASPIAPPPMAALPTTEEDCGGPQPRRRRHGGALPA